MITHNSRLAGPGGRAVRNAFGDVYPWALCAGSAGVRGYAAALAAEVAALAGVDAIELEACGWYGFEHGSAHDKTGDGAARAGADGLWLLSLCFCAECGQAYRSAGADPAKLAAQVRAAADGGPALAADAAGVLDQTRGAASRRLLAEVLDAVRAAAPGRPVLVHSAPDPRAAGANPGYDPAVLCGPGGADGIVLACGNPATAADLVARTAAAAPPGARIAAVLQAVAGPGRPAGDPPRAGRGGPRRRCHRAAPLPRRPGRGGRPGRHRGLLPGNAAPVTGLTAQRSLRPGSEPAELGVVVVPPVQHDLADHARALDRPPVAAVA